MFGGLRALGAEVWQRRYVFITDGPTSSFSSAPSGSAATTPSLCYGKGPAKIDKAIPLSQIVSVDVLTPAQMLDLRAPTNLTHHGWSMGTAEGKEVTWACEAAEVRSAWVRFLREQVGRNNSSNANHQGNTISGNGNANDSGDSASEQQTTAATTDSARNRLARLRAQTVSGGVAPSSPNSPREGSAPPGGGSFASKNGGANNKSFAALNLKPNLASLSSGIIGVASKIGAGVRAVGRAASPNFVFGGNNNANPLSSGSGDQQGGGEKPPLSNCRIEVLPPSAAALSANMSFAGGGGGGAAAPFQVFLVRKTDGAVLRMTERTWDAALGFASMVRSIAPKLDLPPQPRANGVGVLGGAASASSASTPSTQQPLEVQRAAYMAKLCNAALDSASLFRLPEVHSFVGYAQYSEEYDHAARAGSQSPKLRRSNTVMFGASGSASSPTASSSLSPSEFGGTMYFGADGQLSSRPVNGNASFRGASMGPNSGANNNNMSFINLNGSFVRPHLSTPANNSNGSPTPTNGNGGGAPDAAATPQARMNEVAQCFRILDEASSGYVASEDLEGFFAALYSIESAPESSGKTPPIGPAAAGSTSESPPSRPLLSADTIAAVRAHVQATSAANDGAYNGPAFVQLVGEVSKLAKVTIEQWVGQYKRNWYTEIYKAFGVVAMGGGGNAAAAAASATAMPVSNASFFEGGFVGNQSIVMDRSVLSPLGVGAMMGSPLGGGGGGGLAGYSGGSPASPTAASPLTNSQSTGAVLRFDGAALLALRFVLTEAGLRVISQKELAAFKARDAPYTQTLTEFVALMGVLSGAVSLEEMLNVTVKAKHRTQHKTLLKILNERAADQRYVGVAEGLRRMMQSHRAERLAAMGEASLLSGGGGASLLLSGGKCPSCEATEARLRSLRGANEELEREAAGLHDALAEAEAEIDAATQLYEAKANDYEAVKAELAAVRTELARARSREETNAARLLAADAEVRRLTAAAEQQRAATEGDVTQHAALYFLSPMAFGSSASAPVVDLPGALVYNLPASFKPLGISMDVYLTGVGGREYLSCRDDGGRRSIGWQLSVGDAAVGLSTAGAAVIGGGGSPTQRRLLGGGGSPSSALITGAAAATGSRVGNGVGAAAVLTVPGTLASCALPLRKWTRVQARIAWARQTFDLFIDGSLAMEGLPLRDAMGAAAAIAEAAAVSAAASASGKSAASPRRGGKRSGGGGGGGGGEAGGRSAFGSTPNPQSAAAVTTAAAEDRLPPGAIASIAVLDVYPRQDVIACYANMNFFSEEGAAAAKGMGDGGDSDGDLPPPPSSSASASSSRSTSPASSVVSDVNSADTDAFVYRR